VIDEGSLTAAAEYDSVAAELLLLLNRRALDRSQFQTMTAQQCQQRGPRQNTVSVYS